MNSRWIVVNQQTTNSIVVSSSYSMVGEINHLANPQNEGVIKALLLLKKIYNLKAKPQDAKAYKEEGYNAGSQCIHGDTKHNVWPAPVQSIYRSNRADRLIGLC
jgi:hypothetical protein